MNNISLSSFDIHYIDELSKRDIPINKIHPLIKLVVTLLYCFVVISFNKYDLLGILPFIIYPVILFVLSEIQFLKIGKRLIIVLPIIIGVGIFNPIFDKSFQIEFLTLTINSGWISFITLIIKGILTVLSAFLLIGTTSIEKICYSLRLLKVPKVFVNQILLTYRYIFLLLTQAANIYNGYSLRAPKQKGINYKVWGPLLGQLLLRSFDRANNLYDSMLLRGFTGEFKFGQDIKINSKDIIYGFIWISIFIMMRFINIPMLIAGVFR